MAALRPLPVPLSEAWMVGRWNSGCTRGGAASVRLWASQPTTLDVQLFHVGIVPVATASTLILRSCVVGDNLRGTTGLWTLRRPLAALLSEQQGWRSPWRTRPLLVTRNDLAMPECVARRL